MYPYLLVCAFPVSVVDGAASEIGGPRWGENPGGGGSGLDGKPTRRSSASSCAALRFGGVVSIERRMSPPPLPPPCFGARDPRGGVDSTAARLGARAGDRASAGTGSGAGATSSQPDEGGAAAVESSPQPLDAVLAGASPPQPPLDDGAAEALAATGERRLASVSAAPATALSADSSVLRARASASSLRRIRRIALLLFGIP